MIYSDEKLETKKSILDLSEIEIDFEMGRRKYSPEAPSRITCLFMVENNDQGRDLLNEIYGYSKKKLYEPELLKIGICQLARFSKVDCNWFNKYGENKDKNL